MKVKRRICFVLSAALAVILAAAISVHAADYEYVETDVSAPGDGCVMLGVYGSYYSDPQEALNRINEIRYEACTDGKTPDPRNASRMLSASDYVPMKWSTSLEKIARIRAVEGGTACGHVRHNGKGCFSVSYGGITSVAENLAYNSSTSMVYSIDSWYSERTDWVEQNEKAVTGHYTALINPNYTYIGLGLFQTDAGSWTCNCAAAFSSREGSLGTSFLDAPKNVMQKIEVKETYIDEYYINQPEALYLDGQQKLEFRVKDTAEGGKSISKLWVLDPVTWSSSDSSIADVKSDGTVTGAGLGTATVTARAGNKTATLSINVKCKHSYEFGDPDGDGKCQGKCSFCGDTINIVPPTQFSAFWRNDQTETSDYFWPYLPSDNPNGSNIEIMITNINGDEGYRDMVVETSDPLGAPVNKTYYGYSIGVQTAGLVDVYVYPMYNPAAKKTFTLRMGDPGSVSIGDAEVTLGTQSYTYSGSERRPDVSVTYDGRTLDAYNDYTVSYEENVNAGTAKAIVTGKGIWSGTITKEFSIEPADISGSSASLTLSQTSFVCDGSPKEPKLTVKYSGKTLTNGTDYDVEYANNVYLGTATATVKGKGNYTGSRSSEFKMTHTNHNYSETINQAPTCTKKGSATYTCKVCKYTEERTLLATGKHTIVVDERVEPNCTSDGLTEGSHCSVCGNTLEEQKTIPALGHKPGSPVHENEVAATCTEDGSYDEVTYCTVCEEELSREARTTEALGHDYNDMDGTAVAPTCVDAGKEADSKCSRCGNFVEGSAVAALGHKPGSPVHENEVAATCTEDGNYDEVTYCTVCEEELSRESKISEALCHNWGEWTVTKAATTTEEGEKTRTCKNDSAHTEHQSISMIVIEPGTDPDQKGTDGTAVGEGASAAAAEKTITQMKNDNDPAGSLYSKLQLRSSGQTNTSITLTWIKSAKAVKFVLYGNKCGKASKPQKIATVTGKNAQTVKKVAGKKLKKGTYYKFIVVALDKNNNVVSTSKLIHVATKGGKVGNHKSVKVSKSVITKAKKLKKGSTLKLNAAAVLQSKTLKAKQHTAIRYESTNTKIATVSKNGKVKAKKKGSCYVYAYAQNGVFKKIKIIVK